MIWYPIFRFFRLIVIYCNRWFVGHIVFTERMKVSTKNYGPNLASTKFFPEESSGEVRWSLTNRTEEGSKLLKGSCLSGDTGLQVHRREVRYWSSVGREGSGRQFRFMVVFAPYSTCTSQCTTTSSSWENYRAPHHSPSGRHRFPFLLPQEWNNLLAVEIIQ